MNVQRGTRARKIKSQNGRTLYPEILYFKDFFRQDFLVTKFRTLFPQDFLFREVFWRLPFSGEGHVLCLQTSLDTIVSMGTVENMLKQTSIFVLPSSPSYLHSEIESWDKLTCKILKREDGHIRKQRKRMYYTRKEVGEGGALGSTQLFKFGFSCWDLSDFKMSQSLCPFVALDMKI